MCIRDRYYTGLRIGEVCGLTWQDINLEEQYLTVRRSMRYNGTRPVSYTNLDVYKRQRQNFPRKSRLPFTSLKKWLIEEISR